ncbi:MAG: helix-turn-helix domain-containing protein [Archaeoglobaceae archaeon]
MDQPDCPVINACRDSEVLYFSPFWTLTEKTLSARTYAAGKDSEVLQNSLEELEHQPNVFNLEVLSRSSGKVLLKLKMGETSARNIIMRNGGYIIGPFIVSRGLEIWQIAFDNKNSMEQAIYELDKSPNEFKIMKQMSVRLDTFSKIIGHIEEITRFINALENLTTDEKMLLHSAIRLGFYEDPRKITLSQLAREYGFTAAGMSKKIRKVEKKVLLSIKPLLEDSVKERSDQNLFIF